MAALPKLSAPASLRLEFSDLALNLQVPVKECSGENGRCCGSRQHQKVPEQLATALHD